MRSNLKNFAFLLIGLNFLLVACFPGGQTNDENTISFEIDGNNFAYTIEIAETEQERAVGLMHRREMPEDAGMLFDFHQSDRVSFWMKDTYIPLDMIFISEDGRIAHIHKNSQPLSLTPIGPDEPVRFVLELNAGQTDKIGLIPGHKAQHPRMQQN